MSHMLHVLRGDHISVLFSPVSLISLPLCHTTSVSPRSPVMCNVHDLFNRPVTSGHLLFFSHQLNSKLLFSNKIFLQSASRPAWEVIFCICARPSGSSSDFLKSWGGGGGVWRSRVEHVCRVVYLWCTVCYCPCHLWHALPYSAAPTVCIRLAGSLHI